MSACAVCRLPLGKGQPFRVVGTEAMHDACVARASASVLHHAQERSRLLEAELVSRTTRLEGQLRDALRDATEQRVAAERSRGEREESRHEAAILRGRTLALQQEAAQAQRAQAEVPRLIAEIQTLRAQVASLTSEINLLRALAQAIPHAPLRSDPPAHEDASVTRMSLLELDKP